LRIGFGLQGRTGTPVGKPGDQQLWGFGTPIRNLSRLRLRARSLFLVLRANGGDFLIASGIDLRDLRLHFGVLRLHLCALRSALCAFRSALGTLDLPLGEDFRFVDFRHRYDLS